MLKALAHACYVVRDLDVSIGFYEKLGCTRAFDFINDAGERFGVYLHVGGRSFIELFVGSAEAPAEGQSYKHICLEVDDVQEAVPALRAQGLEVTGATLGSDHSWQAWLADPDGNRIELHGYTAESKQGAWLK